MNATLCFDIFKKVIDTYHIEDSVETPLSNPHSGIEGLLYHKCWIDTVQWHYEDIIRDPNINPDAALVLKRKIDASNQDRTDMVEKIDDWFWNYFGAKNNLSCGKINTESPAWVVDRLSILALKIYHMQEQVDRTDADAGHQEKVIAKLNVLLEQKEDLSLAFNQLIDDVMQGKKYMKVYRQMKMYNDESLNPVLYKK
ncbi:MAG: DUF4254 domain-containing protein [Flavobacteriales bacterium]